MLLLLLLLLQAYPAWENAAGSPLLFLLLKRLRVLLPRVLLVMLPRMLLLLQEMGSSTGPEQQ